MRSKKIYVGSDESSRLRITAEPGTGSTRIDTETRDTFYTNAKWTVESGVLVPAEDLPELIRALTAIMNGTA